MQMCVKMLIYFQFVERPYVFRLEKVPSCSSPNEHADQVLYLNTMNRRVVQMLNEYTRSAGFRKSASLE